MTPINISTATQLSNAALKGKLELLSYTFCVNADFSKVEQTTKLIDELEMHVMEGLMRILEVKFGHRPFQNKIYEKVERVFKNQDVYNINRMMSSIRRTKLVPLDAENEKYTKWMKNRVNYGVKSIIARLVYETQDVEMMSEEVEMA
jgi:hypothetical protein